LGLFDFNQLTEDVEPHSRLLLDLSGQFTTAMIAPKPLHTGKIIFSGERSGQSHLLPAIGAVG
jgi:hypothetical protein